MSKTILHVLVWLPTVIFGGFAMAILTAWCLGGVHVSQDLAARALVAGMAVAPLLGFAALFLSLEVIE